MKTKLFSIFLFSLNVLSFGCNKEETDSTPTYGVPGLWMGTYTVTARPQQAPLAQNFVFKPDGKMITEGTVPTGEVYYSEGTWLLTGNTLTANYTTINFPDYTVNQTASFTFDKSGILTNGTWTDVNNPYGTDYSGNFSTMERVK